MRSLLREPQSSLFLRHLKVVGVEVVVLQGTEVHPAEGALHGVAIPDAKVSCLPKENDGGVDRRDCGFNFRFWSGYALSKLLIPRHSVGPAQGKPDRTVSASNETTTPPATTDRSLMPFSSSFKTSSVVTVRFFAYSSPRSRRGHRFRAAITFDTSVLRTEYLVSIYSA